MDMKILILGANGFIGSHLCDAILGQTSHHIFALDRESNNLKSCQKHSRFTFHQADLREVKNWMIAHIKKADVVIPLAAIATPGSYVKTPLKVFELDFEANLQIVRWCVQYKKHLIFPSTSEVYGSCRDEYFDEDKSLFVTGPLHKERWIYASSKQLMDRLIYAYGKHEGLNYTLFRPFNWYGPRLDNNVAMQEPSRVLTQFIRQILRNEDILLVDGGLQKRSFTYIEDGIHALLKIIENKNHCASQKVFNLGNPNVYLSIKMLAESLLALVKQKKPITLQIKSVAAEKFYGVGYEDIPARRPCINRAQQYLHWTPKVELDEGLERMLAYFLDGKA